MERALERDDPALLVRLAAERLKALRLEDYAPTSSSRPGMLQQVLFPYTDAV